MHKEQMYNKKFGCKSHLSRKGKPLEASHLMTINSTSILFSSRPTSMGSVSYFIYGSSPSSKPQNTIVVKDEYPLQKCTAFVGLICTSKIRRWARIKCSCTSNYNFWWLCSGCGEQWLSPHSFQGQFPSIWERLYQSPAYWQVLQWKTCHWYNW